MGKALWAFTTLNRCILFTDAHASHPQPRCVGHEGEAVPLRHQHRRLGDRVLRAPAHVFGESSAS